MNNEIKTRKPMTRRRPVDKKPALQKLAFDLGIPANAKFNDNSLIEVLEAITFGLININLTTKKENINAQGAGYATIGYVAGFEVDQDDTYYFNVLVFDKYVDEVNKTNNVIIPRVFTNKEGEISKIIGLDLVPCSEDKEEVEE